MGVNLFQYKTVCQDTSNSTEKQQDTNWKSQIVTSNPSHNDGAKILMSQNATSIFAKMGLRKPPYAFTRKRHWNA